MMADSKDVTTLKKKLDHLQTEEKLILELLEDVRKEIEKYEVERWHLNGLKNSPGSDDDSDNLYIDERNENPVDLDSAAKINVKPVDLGFRSDLVNEEDFDEDEDESENDGK